tara:strand:- start:451 stop:660 length:210 start_codon:yes stop_codon:yes gene_type:complete
MNLTRDELSSIAQAIQAAWNAGSVRDPQGAMFLLTGSEKLRREWERLNETTETSDEEKPTEPSESSVAA